MWGSEGGWLGVGVVRVGVCSGVGLLAHSGTLSWQGALDQMPSQWTAR